MTTIHYTDNTSVESDIQIWDDLHNGHAGYYRAFWVAKGGTETCGSPVIGYCSSGGSHRTIKAVVAEVRRLGYNDPIWRWRNGRLCQVQQ